MKTTKEKIAVMQAFEDGKPIEFCDPLHKDPCWTKTLNPSWSWRDIDYRIAHEPKLRLWKPEEVPVGALIRYKHKPSNIAVILGVITSNDSTGVGILFPPRVIMSEFVQDWFTYHGGGNGDRVEHSTDHGKTWHPCGIKE